MILIESILFDFLNKNTNYNVICFINFEKTFRNFFKQFTSFLSGFWWKIYECRVVQKYQNKLTITLKSVNMQEKKFCLRGYFRTIVWTRCKNSLFKSSLNTPSNVMIHQNASERLSLVSRKIRKSIAHRIKNQWIQIKCSLLSSKVKDSLVVEQCDFQPLPFAISGR